MNPRIRRLKGRGRRGPVVSTVTVRVAMSDMLPAPSSAENETSLSPSGSIKESVQLPSVSAIVVVASAPSVPATKNPAVVVPVKVTEAVANVAPSSGLTTSSGTKTAAVGVALHSPTRSLPSSSAKTHHNSDGCGNDRTLGLLRRGGGKTGGMIICGACTCAAG